MEAVAAVLEEGAGPRCALALSRERIVGLALVRFSLEGEPRFGVVEDLLVEPRWRGRGMGHRFMEWIEAQCRHRGCRRLFLESGIGNDRAHAFFEREGFAPISVVMARELRSPEEA